MIAPWRRIRDASAPLHRTFRRALRDPGGAQRALLAQILANNSGTTFGRRHGFERIDSFELYREAVPIRGYDGFSDAILEMSQDGRNQLLSDPILAFEETGGTSSGGKLVPYGEPALKAFGLAIRPWLYDLIARHPGMTKGRLYASISPATRPPRFTPGGVPVGLGSDAAYLGDLAEPFMQLLAVPGAVGMLDDIDAWRLETLEHLLEAVDLSFVSVWSPSFFTALIDALPGLADRLMPRLGPSARHRLERWLKGPENGTATLWPDLAVISAWTDASSAPHAARLATLCPQARIEPKGVLATEAAITVPLGDQPGGFPALLSTFIEFREPGTDRCLLADELTPGASYDAILTTAGGFYRYDIGDRFRCVAMDGGCARLVFEGRAGVVSDMVGEKLEEAFVSRVLAALGGPARLEACEGPPPGYRLVLGVTTPLPDIAALDRALSANPQYAYARKLGQLGPLRAARERWDAAEEAERRARAGQRLGDVKPAVLVSLSGKDRRRG